MPPVICNPITYDCFSYSNIVFKFQIRICFVKRWNKKQNHIFFSTFRENHFSLWANVCWRWNAIVWRFEHCVHFANIFLLIALDAHTYLLLDFDCLSFVFWVLSHISNKQQWAGPSVCGVFQVAHFVLFRSTFNFFHVNCFPPLIDSIVQILWRANISRFRISSCLQLWISDPSLRLRPRPDLYFKLDSTSICTRTISWFFSVILLGARCPMLAMWSNIDNNFKSELSCCWIIIIKWTTFVHHRSQMMKKRQKESSCQPDI